MESPTLIRLGGAGSALFRFVVELDRSSTGLVRCQEHPSRNQTEKAVKTFADDPDDFFKESILGMSCPDQVELNKRFSVPAQ